MWSKSCVLYQQKWELMLFHLTDKAQVWKTLCKASCKDDACIVPWHSCLEDACTVNVICQLEDPYSSKLWARSWKCYIFKTAGHSFFSIQTYPKYVNILYFPLKSLKFITVGLFHTHVEHLLSWLWSERKICIMLRTNQIAGFDCVRKINRSFTIWGKLLIIYLPTLMHFAWVSHLQI